MVITQYKNYWILVTHARRGDEDCVEALELMAEEVDKPGLLARGFLMKFKKEAS